ncbi:serine hydrolase [Microbacterium sp. SORGH_AS_0888]|uniref:serine hydrolase domain-containing protein n=1 Tax=Microbacterium sp. SORGH_AS_0888 TaxID=3041791 RepID=UPI0027897C4A|nr:serine hydrolase domain-containing protein [Microbacterium sp. SORGH_AS_0888]MDQ1129816.1 D-alanyl-D-alanine carboxypeptidase [Microbacterium sp. SORGH_AS_0888]
MTLLIRTAVRRVVAASAVAAVVLTGATACTSGAHVDIHVPAQVDAAFPEDVQSQMQSAVEFAMAATGSSSAIVGVWAPWSGTWVTALGQGATDDVFRAGDVTRAMTCDAVFRLAETGALSLDDPVKKYVAGVAGLPDQITLRDLCNGTSGLGSYSSRLSGDFLTTPARVWNPSELASYGAGTVDPAQVGVAWRDSDAGYVLLGLVLERVTGRSASQVLEDQVFSPLDLDSTSLPGDAAAAPGTPALTGTLSLPVDGGGVDCAAPTDVTVRSASSGFTDSGAVTTIDDLGRYAQALATGALVPASANRFATPLPVAADQPSWFTATGGAFQAGSLIGQFGSAPGYITAAFADPTTGMAVAVVLNNSAANDRIGADLAWQLAAIASKAPPAAGQTAPDAGLPWTAAQLHDAIAGLAVCPLPAS